MLHSNTRSVFNGLVLMVVCLWGHKAVSQSVGPPSILLSSDANCVVVIDGKVVGRIKAGQKESFRVNSGPHKVSALDDPGNLWEQMVDVGSEPSGREISFAKVQADQLMLTTGLASQKSSIAEQEEQLAKLKSRNENLERNAERVREERGLIVNAINHYADSYGKQLGMHDSDEAMGKQLIQAGSQQTTADPNSMSNAEAIAKTAVLIFGGISLWNAHRHDVAARAVRDRMAELEEALKDPLAKPRAPEQTSYLVMIRAVTWKKSQGQLLTAPGRVEYRDSQNEMKLTCQQSPRASGAKKISVHYVDIDSSDHDGQHAKKRHHGGRRDRSKRHKHKLHFRASSKKEGKLIVTDVALACPKE